MYQSNLLLEQQIHYEEAQRLKPVNKEGLTWTEWWCATGLFRAGRYGRRCTTVKRATLSKAWLAGEDPSDWRAAAEKGEITLIKVRKFTP